jgi:ribosomal protein S18 acetylase RimI-like enzyme
MRLRAYQPTDVEAMYQLDLACFDEPFQFDREMMYEAAEAASAIVVVVEDEAGAMQGFIIVHAEGAGSDAYGYIVTIDVAPSARRSGVGAVMLREAEAQALRHGLGRVGLHVAMDNAGAIAFYERAGYRWVGVEKGFYHEAKQDALTYVKQL